MLTSAPPPFAASTGANAWRRAAAERNDSEDALHLGQVVGQQRTESRNAGVVDDDTDVRARPGARLGGGAWIRQFELDAG